MKGFTPRQQEILDLIRSRIKETSRPPTRAEIAQILGFKSANAAEDHLQALARKGAIALDASTSRGIRLLGHQAEHSDRDNQSGSDTLLSLPLVGKVAAGYPMLAQEHIETRYPVDRNLFSQQPDYLLKVCGLSMRDIGILDGDLLAVKKTGIARHGQIVVARINDEVTVKRYNIAQGHIKLMPENPNFSPIEVDENRDDFAIEGLAVGLIRPWELN